EISVRDVVRIGRLPRHGLFGAITAEDEAAVDAALMETECDGYASRRLSEISGGERQRALLARVLAVQAQVLLLDEPTTHLDAPHQRALVRSLAARARAGAAVAAVMHDLTLALAADRLLVMAAGRLRADGAPADARVRDTLVEVFGRAFSIERVDSNTGTRWAVLPAL
ncbi:MAG: ABC transporter ATP-binding protein, partial [Burkholderiaceae bacterium]|nr:ABC transporter ATP-binding protein [Burkholderiaceae bacterium]